MCKMEEGGGRGGREREDGGRASMIAKVISSTSTRLVQQRLDRGLHGAVVHNNSAGFILPLPRLGYGSVGSRRRQQLYQSQESKASGTMSGLDERGDESRKTANGEKRDKNTFAADTNAAAAFGCRAERGRNIPTDASGAAGKRSQSAKNVPRRAA